jgi:hypothetical protein
MNEKTLRVGSIVHYWWSDLGFDLGPSAAIVTRVYEANAITHEATECVDLAIFPASNDQYTRSKQSMVWHRDSERCQEKHYWCWPEENADTK